MPIPSAPEPPVTQVRSRPRKTAVPAAPAPTAPKPSARQASTKTTSAKKTMDAQKEKKRILTKAATYTAKKNAPAPTSVPASASAATPQTQPQQPTPATPATPSTSKIINEVRAAGTFASPKHQKQAPIDLPPSRTPAYPTTIPLPRKPTLPTPSSSSAASPAPNTNSTPPPARPNLSFARPAAPSRAPRPQHARSRVIEPTPNVELPSKYKPAMRRVTTILVGIPIILVVGYELWNRARAEIRSKWDDGGKRI
jgi:hypothetical protein